MQKKLTFLILTASFFMFSCGESTKQIEQQKNLFTSLPDSVQAISLLGEKLETTLASTSALERYRNNIAAEEAKLAADPDNAEALIWKGRWTGYTGDYREAIKVFTEGIEKYPEDARFLRHRGHRYISIREFNRAIDDLEAAAALIVGTENTIEPDGMPNSRNIPTSTLHGNIWYHLGLAYYLQDDMENALRAYKACFEAATNPDAIVSSAYWVYMILRRQDMNAEAVRMLNFISADMDVIENQSYHNLLLFYKGEITEEVLVGEYKFDSSSNTAMGYGFGNWHFFNGNVEKAKEIYAQILSSDQWASFGYVAAEADMSRIK